MSQEQEFRIPDLYKLIKNFVFELYPIAKKRLDERDYLFDTYDEYPRLKYRKNGMPDIDLLGDKPKNISKLFRNYGKKPDIELKDYESFNDCINHLVNSKDFQTKLCTPFFKKDSRFLIGGEILLENILERYYLLNDSGQDEEELLRQIYAPLEEIMCSDKLWLDFSIPLLFVHFDFDEYKINELCSIRKIKDEYHKARLKVTCYSPAITSSLLSCATHEFVYKNWYVENTKGPWGIRTDIENMYPTDAFDNFISAIKISTNISTGYAQMLMYPKSWVFYDYQMDLPSLSGMSIKRYPYYFEDYYWNEKEYPHITTEQMPNISMVYNTLKDAKENRVRIANKRLRYSFMRKEEEDTILDIIIAMEVLLTDNENGEITHKLALRTAKLLSLFRKEYDPMEVFKNMKKIYSFRSNIVHGNHSKKASKQDIAAPLENHQKSSPEILLANDYLRIVIQILLEHPKMLDVKEIDKMMILSD